MVTEPYLNKAEVARRLGISRTTLERYIDEKGFPATYVGPRLVRFDWADVQAWVAKWNRDRKEKGQ